MSAEDEMREQEVPRVKTLDELKDYIQTLVDRQHDYGTCVHAMSMAATSAFLYVADKLEVTGFQASCAELDFLRRTRRLDCPFVIITADDELYPQYDNDKKLRDCRIEWEPWISKRASELLKESGGAANPYVIEHWEKLASEDVE
jgi:hypothetical protein